MGEYIKFIGDYSQLKHLGFVFQNLYAGNYMQWNNDGFRVWKRGAELTIDGLVNYEGAFLKLILDMREKKLKTTQICESFLVVKYHGSHKITADKESIAECKSHHKRWYDWYEGGEVGEEPVYSCYTECVEYKLAGRLFEMYDSKMIELGTYTKRK